MSEVVVNARTSRGWRLDPSSVYCGRPGPYGNPHKLGWCALCQVGHARGEAVAAFRRDSLARASDPAFKSHVERLRGKRLVCFCAPLPCHCDVYVELLKMWSGGAS